MFRVVNFFLSPLSLTSQPLRQRRVLAKLFNRLVFPWWLVSAYHCSTSLHNLSSDCCIRALVEKEIDRHVPSILSLGNFYLV